MRQGHWAVVDLIGKGGHIRTVPIPNWVKAALDQWIRAAGVTEGRKSVTTRCWPCSLLACYPHKHA